MYYLAPAVWKEIEKQAVMVGHVVRSPHIELGKLRTILKKSRRTNEQNRLLFALYQDILDKGGEALRGFTKDDLHEFFLIDFFGSETKELFGRKRLKPLNRSSKLTKGEFSDYIEHIVRFASEHSIVLELPGEQAA